MANRFGMSMNNVGNNDNVSSQLRELFTKSNREFVNTTGDEMTGDLEMNNNSIKNVKEPIDEKDVVNKQYVDSLFSNNPIGPFQKIVLAEAKYLLYSRRVFSPISKPINVSGIFDSDIFSGWPPNSAEPIWSVGNLILLPLSSLRILFARATSSSLHNDFPTL